MGHLFSAQHKWSRRLGLTVSALLAIAFFYLFFLFPAFPYRATSQEIILEITSGSSLKNLVNRLSQQGVFSAKEAVLTRIWIRLKGAQKRIQAGEYAFNTHMTPKQLLNKLLAGDVVQYSLTLPEGITFHQALEIIQHHPAIKKTLVPGNLIDIMTLFGEIYPSPEGLFFPNTYYFPRYTSDRAVLQRAHQTLKLRLAQAWEKRAPHCILSTPYEALILASIVEKEAAVPTERPLISGVFQRRLMKKMRLQADPCVIYGLGMVPGTLLTKAHLRQDTPYNTYLRAGLPPSPIALVGMDSLEAALHPDEGAALYFVANGDGTHYFSDDLIEHNEAVARWRKWQKEKQN